MKTFEQLTTEQQEKAVNFETAELLKGILEGGIRFSDELNKDDLQARIDAAIAQAEEKQTPWFAHEYILDTCREEVEGIGWATAEDALYPEPGEYVSRVPRALGS